MVYTAQKYLLLTYMTIGEREIFEDAETSFVKGEAKRGMLR